MGCFSFFTRSVRRHTLRVVCGIVTLFAVACATHTSGNYKWVRHNPDGTTTVGYSSFSSTDPDAMTKILRRTSITGQLPRTVLLGSQIDGLFIGISNYEPAAERAPMPAHAIAAAFAYSLFKQAADRTAQYDDGAGASKSTLMTDLRLDPKDASWDADNVSATLSLLPDVPLNRYDKGAVLPSDNLWPYLKSAQRLSKAAILAAAREQAARIARSSAYGHPIAIFYLATHGAIGPENKAYAMAADSVDGDLSTWISYQELADVLAPSDPSGPPISAILLFDTCLTGPHPDSDATGLSPPPGVEILTAAAPGQYSWHWRETFNAPRITEATKGSGLSRQNLKLPAESYYYSLSVLPLAAAHALRTLELQTKKECEENETHRVATVTSVDWLKDTTEEIDMWSAAAQMRNAKEPYQTTQIFMAPTTAAEVEQMYASNPRIFKLFKFSCYLVTEKDDPDEPD
jgi:hypothetical protein